MIQQLVLHQSALKSAATKLLVSAKAELFGHRLSLKFNIESGDGAPKLIWPANNSIGTLSLSRRRDELWKTTCLEAFIYFDDGKYIELNFSPAGEWNAYSFDSYREGMKQELRIIEVADFNSSISRGEPEATYELSATIDLAQAVKSPQNFRLGLTCVIETDDGERSYWSLKHPGDKPDFHDSRGYVLEMRI